MPPVRTVTYVSGSHKQENGAADRTRTYDPIITNDVLYQLSYSGILLCPRPYYGPTRTSTHCLTHWLHARIASGPAHYEGPALPDELLRFSGPTMTLLVLCGGCELTGFASHSSGALLVMNFGAH